MLVMVALLKTCSGSLAGLPQPTGKAGKAFANRMFFWNFDIFGRVLESKHSFWRISP